MSTEQTEIVSKLESLQKEIRNLSLMLSDQKSDEFRRVVSEKMTDLLSETNVQRMNTNLNALADSSICPNREMCLEKIREILAVSVDRYKKNDLEGARESIEQLEGILCGSESPCRDGDCSSVARNLIRETKLTMDITDKIKENVSGERAAVDSMEGDADKIAKALDPLSYPARVRILQRLDGGELSFSDLSASLGLRTGHLQHHLRPLCDAGYVGHGSGRGRYVITQKGRKALDGVGKLVASL